MKMRNKASFVALLALACCTNAMAQSPRRTNSNEPVACCGAMESDAAEKGTEAKWIKSKTRQRCKKYWSKLSPQKADKLEQQLVELTRKSQKGADVTKELNLLRKSHPQIFRLSKMIKSDSLSAGSNQAASGSVSCEGISWVGRRTGRLFCIGRLTIDRDRPNS